MNRSLNIIAILLLVASGWRLTTVASERQLRMAEVEQMRSLIPHSGSLSGVDVFGNMINAEKDKDGHLRNKGHLLMFALQNVNRDAQLKMWRSVLEDANSETLQQQFSSLQVWAVCDEGALCRVSVPKYITLVGYLDPSQMRALVNVSTKHQALLYDSDKLLKSPIDLSGTSNDIARRLAQEVQ